MKTPVGKPLSLIYVSYPAHEMKMRWSAKLHFKGGESDDSILALEIHDGEGDAVENGIFELAGKSLPVKNGAAYITGRDFVAGKHERAVWLHRPGMAPVSGGLTFA